MSADVKMKAVGAAGADFWAVEMAIPLAALSEKPPRGGAEWKMNLVRTRCASGRLEDFVWPRMTHPARDENSFIKIVFQSP